MAKKLTGDLAQTSIGANLTITATTTSGSPTLTAVSAAIAFTGNITSGSATVSNVSNTNGLAVGQTVTGTGIAGSTTISSVGTNTITLSAAATATTVGVSLSVASSGLTIFAAGQNISGTGIPAGATILSANLALGTVTLSVAATAAGTAVALIATETQILGLSEWSIDWKLKTADATTTDDSGYESSLPSTASWTAKAKFVYLNGDPSQTLGVRSAILNPIAQVPARWNFFTSPVQGVDSYTGTAYIDSISLTSGMGKIVGMDCTLKGTGPLFIAQTAAPVTSATITGQQGED